MKLLHVSGPSVRPRASIGRLRLFCAALMLLSGSVPLAAQDAAAPAPPAVSAPKPEAVPADAKAAPSVAQPAAAELPNDAADQSTQNTDTPLVSGAEAAPETKSHLPHDLSPWNMFLAADRIVKGVMIGLAFASLVTWTVWCAKSLELLRAKRRLVRTFSLINTAPSLTEAQKRLSGEKGIVLSFIDGAMLELRLSSDVSDKHGIKERVLSRLDGMVAAKGREMNLGTGVLATIGSTAPFVGLFGTVWGIMNSFVSISETQTTNLAVVAPGIAEALLATAIGLVAAIPAVIIYNYFSRQIGSYKALLNEASAEVMRLVSRDLDRGLKTVPMRQAAE